MRAFSLGGKTMTNEQKYKVAQALLYSLLAKRLITEEEYLKALDNAKRAVFGICKTSNATVE